MGSYCHGGNYIQDNPGWSSRFFVREETPLTPELIAAESTCEAIAGRYFSRRDISCQDRPKFQYFERHGIELDVARTKCKDRGGDIASIHNAEENSEAY
jgi:hypothetical protein